MMREEVVERTCVICWERKLLDEFADADEGGKSPVCSRCAGDIQAVAQEWEEDEEDG